MAKTKLTKTTTEELPVIDPLVVDASELVAGRIASVVAKQLLQGEHVAIINAERAVLSGNQASLVKEYKERLGIRTLTAPWKGPLHHRNPQTLLRGIIRGMVPWKKSRGRMAMKRLRVYTGTPEDFKIKRRLQIPEIERTGRRTVYLGDIARELGWSGNV